jgi:predicted transcriptional regulator
MFSIRRVLENKADSTLWSVQPGDTVLAAITLMAEQRIGAVLVMDGDKLVGILSERDYSRKCVLQGRRSADTVVSEIMKAHRRGVHRRPREAGHRRAGFPHRAARAVHHRLRIVPFL